MYLAGWWNEVESHRTRRRRAVAQIEPARRGLLPVRSAWQGYLWACSGVGCRAAGVQRPGMDRVCRRGDPRRSLMLAFGLYGLPNLLLMGVAAAQLAFETAALR